jgi:hypothetical protein
LYEIIQQQMAAELPYLEGRAPESCAPSAWRLQMEQQMLAGRTQEELDAAVLAIVLANKKHERRE